MPACYQPRASTQKNVAKQQRILFVLFFVILTLLGMGFGQKAYSADVQSMYWLEDESGALTFEQIQQQDLTAQWQKTSSSALNLGYTTNAFWLSMPFENPKNTHEALLLEIAFPLHDYIDVYLLNEAGSVVKTYQSGDKRPFSDRPIQHRNFLFPYTFAPNQKLRAVLRVQSKDAMYIPLATWRSQAFIDKDHNQTLLLGLLFGCLSIMLIYNFCLYLFTQQKNYIYYTLFTSSVFCLQLSCHGLGLQYFWPKNPGFNDLITIFSQITIATSHFFVMKFLNLDKRKYAGSNMLFRTFICLSLLTIPCTIAILTVDSAGHFYNDMQIITSVIGTAGAIVIMAILIRLSAQGMYTAKILGVAWLGLIIGTLLFALSHMGAPIPMFIAENALLIGSTFEAVLLSFALARQIKLEREARIQAQELALSQERKVRETREELIILQKETTRQLEQEVKERTQKLETAMQNLTLANHKLDSLARIDGLTGLSNRRDFDQKSAQVWQHNLQYQTPVSLLMADIDFFKKINDTYGHLTGDECLVHVAKIMKQCIEDTNGLIARFGGEEFIILLPDTDTLEATLIAEHIRHSTEQLLIHHQQQTINFTLSIGIATTIPTADITCNDLISRADQSLYLAKEDGRNRVSTLDNCLRKPDAPSGTQNIPKTFEPQRLDIKSVLPPFIASESIA